VHFSPNTTNRLRQVFFIALAVATMSFTACGTPGSTLGTPNKLAVGPVSTSTSATSSSTTSNSTTSSSNTPSTPPVLLFNGTGTSSGDVSAVEAILATLKLSYATVNSSELDGMTVTQLKAHKLFIVPGGNSITIGRHLSDNATTNVRNAVSNYGLHYLGICAGGFFGGYSIYNGLDLTSGVWFNFYADEFKGIHKEAVEISFPRTSKLDIYWQDGPQLSGWGKIVGKYPDGTPAIVESSYGKGFVILTGIHPEAPASWRTGMKFNTPLSVDLAFAGTLITSALNGTSLPHF
jgi:biotin protein ligase-like protein